MIPICQGKHGVIREIHIHLQLLVGDLLLKGDEHLIGAFLHLEAAHILHGDAAFALQPGNIQHAAHQPAQALGLFGNQSHVVAVPLRRDGAVPHAIDVAADGGHGGFQLVGDVGHKFLAGIFALLQRRGHVVKGQRQLGDLLGMPSRQTHTGIQIAVTEGTGGLGQLPQGGVFAAGQVDHHKSGQHRHHCNAGQKEVGDLGDHAVGFAGGGGHNDITHHRSIGIGIDGSGRKIAGIFVNVLQNAHIADVAGLADAVHIVLGQRVGLMGAAGGRFGAEDDPSALAADQNVHIGDLTGQIQVDEKLHITQSAFGVVGCGQLT